jgi:hypothetical protein
MSDPLETWAIEIDHARWANLPDEPDDNTTVGDAKYMAIRDLANALQAARFANRSIPELTEELQAMRTERDEERMAGHVHSKAADELAQTGYRLRSENETLNKENQRLRRRWYETTAERRAWRRLDEASRVGYYVLNTLTEERYLAHWSKDMPYPWTVHEHSLPLHTQRGFGKTPLEALEMANRDPA